MDKTDRLKREMHRAIVAGDPGRYCRALRAYLEAEAKARLQEPLPPRRQ